MTQQGDPVRALPCVAAAGGVYVEAVAGAELASGLGEVEAVSDDPLTTLWVKTPVWRAKPCGSPTLKNPPSRDYSPSVFSRTTTMSTLSGVAVRIGVTTFG